MRDDDTTSSALGFLFREMDFHLDGINAMRTAISTLIGLGVTIDLGLLALAYRDQRQPEPEWALVTGIVLAILCFVVGVLVLSLIRRAIAWPDAYKALDADHGSAQDLRASFLRDFMTKLKTTRKRRVVLDIIYGLLVVLLISSAAFLVIVLANTPTPVP